MSSRDRIRAAADQHGWTFAEEFGNGPDACVNVFERGNDEGGTDVVIVQFDNNRFSGGSRKNNVPADQGGANDTFWRRQSRGEMVAFEHGGSPKGRVERIIAAFA